MEASSAMAARSLLSPPPPLRRSRGHSEPLSSPSVTLRARSSQPLFLSNLRTPAPAVGSKKTRLVARCSVDGVVNTEVDAPVEKSLFLSYSFAQRSVIRKIEVLNFIYFIFLLLPIFFEGFPPFPAVMDINQIRSILPHR